MLVQLPKDLAMRRGQEPLLGRRELPEDLNDFEMVHFFSLQEKEQTGTVFVPVRLDWN